MTNTHPPRPGDLVALVSFDGDVYANQAVTRERLGRPASAPHALAAAIKQWLGRRPVWIDVRGRQIQGIATARELAGRDVWEIDTLVDATDGRGGVVGGLLRQATEAATEAGVGRVLLRLASGSPAAEEATRAGFAPVIEERQWTRTGEQPAQQATEPAPDPRITVREAAPAADAFFEFQLYCRALPFEARQALGLTFDEWAAALDRRATGRGARRLLAFAEGQPRAVLALEGRQATVLAEPGHEAAADALLHHAARTGAEVEALALQPECAATPASVLRAHGFAPAESYTRLAMRTMRQVREGARQTVRSRTRTVVPSGG